MKVLFNLKVKQEQFQRVKDLGYDVVCIPDKRLENSVETDDADILVAYNPFETLDISKMKKLKYIILTSVGFDQLPKEKVLAQNIQVSNNKGGYSIPMSEWIVMCILEIYKKARSFYTKQDKKLWSMDLSISELYGQRIGFLGTGAIAVESAKRLKGFGVELWGYNTNGRDVKYFDRCFSKNQIDEIFKNCDVVVSTMPCTAETEGMLNKDKFALMKKGSSFINVGRGKLVKEDDLVQFLDKFKGVALDVFENEPLREDSPLWEAENVIVTPHNCWVSNRNRERVDQMIYSNLKKYIKGEMVSNLVNINRGY
ncbi:MAG: phosphoglycerate dehydrogenase [Intestinibacter sp.]